MKDLILYKDEKEITNKKAVKAFYDALPAGKYLVKHTDISGRTLKQNDYLHLLFGMVQEGLYNNGYRDVKTKDDAKFICKDLFFFRWAENGTGGRIKVHKKTSKATKEELSVFIDEVIQWASEYLGIVIPPPGQPTEMFSQPNFKAA